MAIKQTHFQKFADNGDFYMNEVADRGGFVVATTLGSGIANDQGVALVTYAASQSGKVPLGMLEVDVVDKNLAQTHLNYYKLEVQKGSKVNIVKAGEYTTNMIYPGLTIAVQDRAYLGPSGLLQNTNVNSAATPVVGVFLSTKDADGYAKVGFNLP